ncbi:NACHT domain-containing protein [Lentzea sp. PSKA42]|uniref:NACHT domain-containing protein n=1 Tax=Lentzea indica TaxID=2604800 RepID=A0ABX1FH27_9PSEU|nr:NACHT domain-containing protein [Lentzea indica]NKE58031.1 NACHT domain-containing protein [Lentzea indica]
MPSIESAVIRVVVDVSDQLSPRLADKVELRQASATSAATEALFKDLHRADVEALEAYLDSPDFATVVVQKRIGNMMGKAAKDQLREGLRLAGLSDHLLTRVTAIVHDVMVAACQEAAPQFSGPSAKIDRTDLFTAASVNGLVLKRLKSSARIHAFAARMRDQVAALHSRIRLPHVGVSRSVRFDQLYVEPTLASPFAMRLGAPGERVLVQGDPGAGKSTLAAKFAHDIAVDGSGRVPFLLVLREFATSFDGGGRDLVYYLEKLCHAPYNVKPPRDGVEYLLRTGRAVVILDGLDELVQTELRRRVVSLVEGFAHLYPLVPILVTARKVGYEDAPLSVDMFIPSHIAEFSDRQVADYVTRWFELDEATSPAEREQLIRSFMEDSRQIPELRSNPLLLTLLCAMYSSDRYLPRNLAQVYERCALMLFEQWDSKRGIALPLKFHGRLRGAVQHLAWRMFNAAESGKALSRTRIVNILTSYLDTKLDDRDESVAMAEEFLAFCTGRAWILTDMGATESEPQFGFTHRTFLEYFAAEYLVRTHRTAAELWEVLRPEGSQWDVVAQIVLQLYDRNVEDGVDELLTEALGRDGLDFAARALHYTHPSTRVVRAITTKALGMAVGFPIQQRITVHHQRQVLTDAALVACMVNASPVNLPIVEQIVAEHLGELIAQRHEGAALVLDLMLKPVRDAHQRWQAVQRDLAITRAEDLGKLRMASTWAAPLAHSDPSLLEAIIRHHGVKALYHRCSYFDWTAPSVAEQLLWSKELTSTQAADQLAVTMTEQGRPWFNGSEFRSSDLPTIPELDREVSALVLMLSLPYLEVDGRALHQLPQDAKLPEPVRAFVNAWMKNELSVIDRER